MISNFIFNVHLHQCILKEEKLEDKISQTLIVIAKVASLRNYIVYSISDWI